MKTKISAALAASVLIYTGVKADTLELKNGQVHEGAYQGGTAQTLRFQIGTETKVFSRSEVVALTLTGSGNTAAPAAAGASAALGGASAGAGAGQASTAVTFPPGTRVQVRMVDGVDSSKDQAGKRFTGTLESNLSANGATLVPAGTTVHGQVAQAQQAGRVMGQSVLSLVLTDMVLKGYSKPISTTPITLSGQAEGRQTGRRAGLGAAIGGSVGGGEGAGKGAAIGAGTAAIRKGEAVGVPPGALVEFTLSAPLTLPASQ